VHTYSRPTIRMDGYGYYAPLASIVCDGDLDLANELAPAGNFMRNNWFSGPAHRLVDPYPVGAAVLWAPAIAVVWWFAPTRARRSPDSWRNTSPAYEPRYVRTVAIVTAVEALVAAGMLFACLRRRTSGPIAAIAVASCTLGTPLVYYALAEPSYAHAAS